MIAPMRQAEHADIALLLEGTFPYVRGGVSSWINQMIRAFPELSFAIVFIGSTPDSYGEMAYPLPDNVVHMECHYLFDFAGDAGERPVKPSLRGDAEIFRQVAELHGKLKSPQGKHQASAMLRTLMPLMQPGGKLSAEMFAHSDLAWTFLTDNYRAFCTDPSFTDYFWTVRIMHLSIWKLAAVAEQLIPAKVFHTVSTGYAGLLGTMLQQRRARPLLVSEHGIYTKERKIDLFQSQWIRDNRSVFERDAAQIGYFRDLWMRFFMALGQMCYDSASDIVALYEGNRLRQIGDGAPANKTCTIPNGIHLERFAGLRDKRPPQTPPVLCLIGRVVPIKDVKTFIRSMLTVIEAMPEAEAWIAGPDDEDEDYALECQRLVASLGLADKVKFLGMQNVEALMPQIGLVVLSSISEALPLVVLEGFAAGVPSITTEVGACRELIYGRAGEDAALGAAGEVVPIANPSALAQAALSLLQNPVRWRAAQRAGIARVERYYSQTQMVGTYRALYDKLLAQHGGAG
ncbi:GT4 family glycosyltransferase PelF [Paludibacterium purpuratum]|uniref:Glycosyltransferase involved in cell wall biosynthesis n=1 Tax=Paludibacterium purpuratum TaxID=1144873 RepID=A0A4R7B050_9NEIS|nr:GT4 family glycosyltransferase PelF [Paludibacterium purpuratum]TDR73619.1 glycosyltransferase involved in cell wall biosynthesis [Paludibacterium purpuratum]